MQTQKQQNSLFAFNTRGNILFLAQINDQIESINLLNCVGSCFVTDIILFYFNFVVKPETVCCVRPPIASHSSLH